MGGGGRRRGMIPIIFSPFEDTSLLYILDRRYFHRVRLNRPSYIRQSYCQQYIIAESNNWTTVDQMPSSFTLAFPEIHLFNSSSIRCEESWEEESNINYINTALYIDQSWLPLNVPLEMRVCPLFIKDACNTLVASVLYRICVSICVCASVCVCLCTCNCNPSRIALCLPPSCPSPLYIVLQLNSPSPPPPPSRARVDFKRHSRKRNDSCQIFNGT